DDVGAPGEEARGDLCRALTPHRAVAVVHLLVLEEHRRHHGKVRDLLARAHRRGRLLREHHGLDREEVHPALGERLRLLAERRDVLLVGHPFVERGLGRTARPQQPGAVAAVEDEDLARAHALADLPAARRHGDATLASTPTSVLALTTARVESLA